MDAPGEDQLFSHFVACGKWEAISILDILMRNQSTIKPTTIHADTQGQNLPAKEDYRGLTPLFYSHIEPYGMIRLDMEQRLALA